MTNHLIEAPYCHLKMLILFVRRTIVFVKCSSEICNFSGSSLTLLHFSSPLDVFLREGEEEQWAGSCHQRELDYRFLVEAPIHGMQAFLTTNQLKLKIF